MKAVSLGSNCGLNFLFSETLKSYEFYWLLFQRFGSADNRHLELVNYIIQNCNVFAAESKLVKAQRSGNVDRMIFREYQYLMHVDHYVKDHEDVNELREFINSRLDLHRFSQHNVFGFWQWHHDSTFTYENIAKLVVNLEKLCNHDFSLYLAITDKALDLCKIKTISSKIHCAYMSSSLIWDAKNEFKLNAELFIDYINLFKPILDLDYVANRLDKIMIPEFIPQAIQHLQNI